MCAFDFENHLSKKFYFETYFICSVKMCGDKTIEKEIFENPN